VARMGARPDRSFEDSGASPIDDIQQLVRDDSRTVHAQLEAIADATRHLSTADLNPDAPYAAPNPAPRDVPCSPIDARR
jgi:hypothetical protein